MIRRRRNKILGLKINHNTWIFNLNQIQDHRLKHFKNVYSTEFSFSWLN